MDIPANKRKKIRRMENTRHKLQRRERLLAELGYQGGAIYDRHIAKIKASSGYMRTGNLRHYAHIMPSIKTRQRNRHNPVFMPAKRDQTKLDSMKSQDITADSPLTSTGKPSR